MKQMNPFQLGLLNVAHRPLRLQEAYKEYGPMAIDALLSHGYIRMKSGEYLATTMIGRRALADFEAEIDRK